MSNFRRSLLMNQEEVSIFDSAYFYCPYVETQSTTDVNNGITANVSTGSFNSNGYYTNGNNQSVRYYDTNLRSIINSNIYTIYLEFIPYNVSRNFYLFDLGWSYSGEPGSINSHITSLFVYYTNGNKFGTTIDLFPYYDNIIPNSPVVTYGNRYKVCIKWTDGVVYFFINGAKLSINYGHQPNQLCSQILLGANATRTDRGAKADFLKFAIWDTKLSDEDCIKLTL